MMVIRPAIAGLVLLLALLVGATGCGKKTKYPACDGDEDCKGTEKCVNKRCVQCADDADCPAGESCEAGACVKPSGCQTADDCPDNQACKDGKCTACQADADCPTGEACKDGKCIGPGECTTDEDCAEDEDCVGNKCVRGDTAASTASGASCELPTIYFDFDQSTVNDKAKVDLETASKCLADNPTKNASVVGFADPRGPDEYNIALSDQRARVVVEFLSRLGVTGTRLRVIPKGEAEAQGYNEETWVQDRKVELEWD